MIIIEMLVMGLILVVIYKLVVDPGKLPKIMREMKLEYTQLSEIQKHCSLREGVCEYATVSSICKYKKVCNQLRNERPKNYDFKE